MRNRSNAVIVATVVAVALGGVWLAMRLQGPAAAQVATPRTVCVVHTVTHGDGKPDLNGIWQSLTTANWDLEAHGAGAGAYPHLLGAWGAQPGGQSIVEGGVIRMRPEALARKKANFASRATPSVPGDGVEPPLGDPEMKCWMTGVPRMMYMPYPRCRSSRHRTPCSSPRSSTATPRIVRMDWPEETPVDNTFFMGWNRGRWEGDSLVIDVTGLSDKNWLDRAGNFLSDTAHVVERLTAASPYHIAYATTIEDEKVFSRPWKISFPLYRRMERDVQLMEFKCQPFVEELVYGRFTKKPTT